MIQRHEQYRHLVNCEVHLDFMGSLIVEQGSVYGYLQFEDEQNSFWDSCLPKTSDTLDETREMIASGFRQEVWVYDELLDAILDWD